MRSPFMPKPPGRLSAAAKKKQENEVKKHQGEDGEGVEGGEESEGEDRKDGKEEEKEKEVLEQWLLVIGGLDGGTLHASTELLGMIGENGESFQAGPCLSAPRWGCAAVALDGPRVLVVGGFNGECYLDSTEIIDLKSWTCEPGPKMLTARAGCSAVRVDDNQILVVGGYSQDTCEILETEKMSFRPGPQLRRARSCAAAIMLDEYRLMVAGGYDRLGCCETSEILDLRKAPREDEWDDESPPSLAKARFWPGPSLGKPRGGCAVARLASPGRVLFVGGFDGRDRLDSTALLDLGNYVTACTSRPPIAGEAVMSKEEGDDKEAKLYKKRDQDKVEDQESEDLDDEEDEDRQQEVKPKVWQLHSGCHATVVQVFDDEEADDTDEDDEDAEEGTFRLSNPERWESTWQRSDEYVFPPTNLMTWMHGPHMRSRRSGSVAALFPSAEMHGCKPKLFVLGGLDDTPNQALDIAEVLDLAETTEFVQSLSTCTRRAYCAAAVVTVLGKLGKPSEIEDAHEAQPTSTENSVLEHGQQGATE